MLGAIRRLFRLVSLIAQEPEGEQQVVRVRRLARQALAWLIANELLEIVQIYPLRYYIDGIANGRSVGYLLGIVAIMFVIDIVVRIVAAVMQRTRDDAAWEQYTMLLGFGHTKQLSMDVAWHVEHGTYEKESLIAKNLNRIDQLTDRVIYQGLPVAIRIILTIVALAFIQPIFAIFGFTIVVGYMTVMVYNKRYIDPLDQAAHQDWKDIHTRGTELSSKARTLKQFGVESYTAAQYRKMLASVAQTAAERGQLWRHFQRRSEYVLMAAFLAMYGLFALMHGGILGVVSVGSVVLVIEWLGRILVNLYQFRDVQRAVSEGNQALDEYCELFATVPTIRQPDHPVVPARLHGKVALRDVEFAYPGNCTNTLKGINLTIAPNTTVALVGPSGGGKSTIVALLMRETDPTCGVISLDDIDLRQFDYETLRRDVVSVVAQDVQLLDASIADNIRLGNNLASDSAVQEAAKQAHADEFIAGFANGYGTMVGENGVRLSGGQKQRVAIARALLRQPRLLILDEATSALDARSQRFVQQTVDDMIRDRQSTIVIIAHRLSTVRSADVVVYLEDGRIVEQGSHEELMALKGRYSEMVAHEIGEHLD